MPRFWGLKHGKLHAAIWAEACVCVTIFGYNQAAGGGVVAFPAFVKQFPIMDTIDTTGAKQRYNSTIQGTIIALYTLFGTFGALACTFLGDKIGRRWTIWVSCLFNAIGAILMCSSFSLGQFIVSRIILGLGTGGIIATTSVWQSELSKASSRGSHVSAFGIFCGIGLVLALWTDYGTGQHSGPFSWRFPLAFPIVFSAIIMPTIFTLPESPRWLMKMGREQEASEIMNLLHDDPVTIEKEMADIRASLALSGQANLGSLFKMGKQRVFHRVLIGCVAQMMLQLTGVNAITYYAPSLYQTEIGFPANEAGILAAASQFCIIIGSLICSYTVDHFGRRSLMLFSATSMSICFAFIAGLVSQSDNKAALKASAFFLYLYYVVYTTGFLGLPFMYAAEIAPAKQRAAVCGISTAVSWMFNFLVAEVTPVAFTDVGWKYFIVYCVLNAAWVPIVFFFFPETKGRSLEEIDEIFAESHSIWDPVKVAKNLPHRALTEFVEDDKTLDGSVTGQPNDGGSPKPAAEHLEEKRVATRDIEG